MKKMKAAILFFGAAWAAKELPSQTAIRIDVDEEAQKVIFTARLRHDSYLALGFGSTMDQTSMILWQAYGLSSQQS